MNGIPLISEVEPPRPDPADFDAQPRVEDSGYRDLFLEITWDRVDGVSGTLGMENFRFPFPTTPEQAKDIAHAVEVDKHFAVYASARHASAGLHVLVVRATVFRVNHGEKASTIRHETIDPRDGFTTSSILCDPESLPALLRSGVGIARQLATEAIMKVLAGLESGDIIPLEKETDNAG